MTKSKKFVTAFVPIILLSVTIHLVSIYLGWLQADFLTMLKLESIIVVLFVLGALLIAPGLTKQPENFVNRFLILTTVQMLTMLSLLAALVYVKIPDVRSVAFNLISVFIILLLFQSIFLIRLVSKD